MADIHVARETFWFEDDNGPQLVKRGDRVRAGHPILEGRESLFKEDDGLEFDHEQPPVKRGPGRPPNSMRK